MKLNIRVSTKVHGEGSWSITAQKNVHCFVFVIQLLCNRLEFLWCA